MAIKLPEDLERWLSNIDRSQLFAHASGYKRMARLVRELAAEIEDMRHIAAALGACMKGTDQRVAEAWGRAKGGG